MEDVDLIKGKSGIFDVHVNGKLVFSKHDEGRFPIEGEVIERIKNMESQS